MDYRRINRYMENSFSDKFEGKICQLFVDGDYPGDCARNEWDLQDPEQVKDLQEELINSIADEYEMINRSFAAELTEMCEKVDDYIYDCYGDSFISPTGRVVDTAEYMFHMEPEIYYDIAQNIVAATMDHIIDMLEQEGECHFEYFCYKMVKREEEECQQE